MICFYTNRKILQCYLILCLTCVCLAGIAALLGEAAPWANVSSVYFYFSILIGFIFSRNYQFFVHILKFFLLLNAILMLYEFYTFSYLLTPTSDLSHFIGRAKGLISYSKEAGAVALVVATFYIKEFQYRWLLIIFLISILSGSRMSMIFVFSILVVEVLCRQFRNRSGSFFTSGLIFFTVLAGFVATYISLDQSQVILARLMRAFDVDHSSNVERIAFWLKYLAIFAEYDLWSLIFGKPNYAQQAVGNGAESAFLNLLTDGGIISLGVYITAIIVLLMRAPTTLGIIFNVGVLLISMQISRVGLGFLDGTLFWVFFWNLLFESRMGFISDKRVALK